MLSRTIYSKFANNNNVIINMTYNEAVTFLFSMLPAYHRIGKAAYKANLANTLILDEYFKNPHKKFRSIHVAGTNGKGSVSHMLASILMEAGYKTGLYTSPHLRDFRERILTDGAMIPESEVIAFVEKHDDLIRNVMPSFFELTVAMAFDYFARSGVEIAVVETGMGGRLDSTNIILPELSVITNIGHDHMEYLGNTLEAVATEKAGIIKKEVPVVIGETQYETEKVFLTMAESLLAPVTFADKQFRCQLGDIDPGTGKRPWRLNDKRSTVILNGYTPLGGLAQEKNIQTVAEAVQVLKAKLTISDENVVRGIENVVRNTGLKGRWQILSHNPLTVCDTGHNREGLEYVTRQIQMSGKNRIHMVIGFVNDKDLSSILPLMPKEALYYFTRAPLERAMDEKRLRNEAERYGLYGDSYTSVGEALAAARDLAGEDDMIFIGGSTFIVAEVV